jgi:carboxymethylenebutenolidase
MMSLRPLAFGCVFMFLPLVACTRASSLDPVPTPSASPGAGPNAEPSAADSAAPAAQGDDDASTYVEERVRFASGPRTLGGFLYRPHGSGPWPAVLFNHGTELKPGRTPGQASYYVAQGYLLFSPHRRGQGLSAAGGDYWEDVWRKSGRDPKVLVDQLDAQMDDVAAAVTYLQHRPDVDPKRIAVAGCSYGGAEALLAAERVDGIRAAVDFAGGAEMWQAQASLRDRMTRAARGARVPVLFVQAENDDDLGPSRGLGAEMVDAGRASRVAVFPPNGTTHESGHGLCAAFPSPVWGDTVAAFLRENSR